MRPSVDAVCRRWTMLSLRVPLICSVEPFVSRHVCSLTAVRHLHTTSSTPSTQGHSPEDSALFALKKQFLFNDTSGTTSAEDIAADIAWESEGLQLFSPHADGEAKARARKTQLFLRVLLTTDDEQEWRDMLVAAVRLGTWKPHHMQASLRGIAQLHGPPLEGDVDHAGGAEISTSTRASEADVSMSPSASREKRASTPSLRLQRVQEVVKLWWETVAEMQASGEDSASEKPSEEQVYHVLLHLLRAAQSQPNSPPHECSGDGQVGSRTSAPSSPPAASASYADVWRFLAWMEQHDYHILSLAVLPDLEAAVDAEESPQTVEQGASGSLGAPSRYAVISRRVNRLEYLKGEKKWIDNRERERRQLELEAEQLTPLPNKGSGSTPSLRRREPPPRTEPRL